MQRVVVIGAGYAGVIAANRILAKGSDVTVTVVNPREVFVERIRLHQLVAGTSDAVQSLTHVLHPQAQLVIGTVDRIADTHVTLREGTSIAYDYLVYAVGSGGNVHAAKGLAEHGHLGTELEPARELAARVAALPAGATVTVVGGGSLGIEFASEIAEQRPDLLVSLVCASELAPTVGAKARAALTKDLGRLGVAIRTQTRVTEVQPDAADCTIWAAGFGVPDLAARSGLPVDALGRLLVDETLSVPGHPNIIGVGDAVAPPESVAFNLRMSCQTAMPLGAHGADTLLARIRGDEPEPFSLGMLGINISVGRRRAVIQPAYRDDSPRSWAITGGLGRAVKEFVCRSTVDGMVRQRQGKWYGWLKGPARRREAVRV